MSAIHRDRGGRPLVLLMCSAALSVAGACGRRAEVVLQQPAAPLTQQKLNLESRWAFWAEEEGRPRVLLAFARSSREDGSRDFLLYLTLPAERGWFSAYPAIPTHVRGFLVQAVGERRGKAVVVDGSVRVGGVWFVPQCRRIALDLQCADGTQVAGDALVECAPLELRQFERRYARDVAELDSAATQPVGGAPPTPARPAVQAR